MNRALAGWVLGAALMTGPVLADGLDKASVRAMVDAWSAELAAFNFDAFGDRIADDARITLTHPVRREVMELTKATYVDSLRPLAQTWTGMVVVIKSVDIAITGDTSATAVIHNEQKVQGPGETVTRSSRTTLDIQRMGDKLQIVRAEIVPAENAEYRRFRAGPQSGPFR